MNIVKIIPLILLCAVCCGCFRAAPQNERTVEVGLLLRKQFTKDEYENRICRHIHILLPGGNIKGYNKKADKVSFLRYLLTHIEGEVRTLTELKIKRRHYIDAAYAMNCDYHGESGFKMVTLWARFRVTPQQAKALECEWERMRRDPPYFRLFGDNCASRLAESLVKAQILPWGLPGIDRPENVLRQVEKYYPDLTVEEGYFGFDENDRPYMIPLPAKEETDDKEKNNKEKCA